MSILKYKYKAHKFINYAFYVVVFIAGYLLGFGAEKIDFNKLISQVLMIDSVSAHTSTTLNEDIILEKFKLAWEDFSIIDYPNINCYTNNTSSSSLIVCVAVDNETLDSLYVGSFGASTSSRAQINGYNSHNIYRLVLNSDLSINDKQFNSSTNYTDNNWGSGYYTWTNFDFNKIIDNSSALTNSQKNAKKNSISSSTNSTFILLDFSSYLIPKMIYNENLFKDNPDFKEVCVEEGKSFAITSTQMSDINSVYDYDYFWLPYNLNGISKILYDNSVETNEIHYTEEESKERYFYNTKENIDNFYSNDIPGLELEIKGYTDKYSYYGWSAWPFRVYYSESYNQYNIFTIEDPTKIYVGNLNEDGNVHGGGGLRLDGDEEIEISSNYCFYIKNIYELTYVNIDEWGDYHGTVPTPNGDYEFSTSHNKLNSNTDSFLSQPIKFINSMKDTINFINSLIYEFYISLPTLLRTFIITVLIILIIMLIMKIGGYK